MFEVDANLIILVAKFFNETYYVNITFRKYVITFNFNLIKYFYIYTSLSEIKLNISNIYFKMVLLW